MTDQEILERPYRIAAELTHEKVMLAERRAAYERQREIERKARRDSLGLLFHLAIWLTGFILWLSGYGRLFIAVGVVALLVLWIAPGVARWRRARAAQGSEVL